MSGYMNERGNYGRNMQSWNSNVNIETASQDDACSQYSEDLGRDISIRSSDIGQRLHHIFSNQLYTDVKFIISCGIKPKPFVKAHRAILAAGSKKFAEMLFGEGSKEIAKEFHPDIQINNVPFEAFKNVVEFLYTDDVYFCNDSVVMDTLAAAKTFQVQSLVDRCESYFESMEITDDTACSKFYLASTYKMEGLKNRCTKYIQDNTQAVLRSQDFKSSFLATVRNICKMPKLNLRSEIELFDAVLDWADHQTKSSYTSRRELIESLLKLIRFLTMNVTEFTAIVDKFPDLFDTKDALSIVVYLSNPNKNAPQNNLPAWCSKATNRCVLVNMPTQKAPLNRGHLADQKLSISLRPIRRGYTSNLICVLDLKCLRGNHQVKAVKLAFGDPVTEHSCIGHMTLTVDVKPSGFHFVEHIKIENSKELVVPFSRNILVRSGDKFSLRAEANEVRNYYFMQFDEENSFSQDNPFECSLGSVPKDNRLFFISEVLYIATQPRPKNIRNFRGGKHSGGW